MGIEVLLLMILAQPRIPNPISVSVAIFDFVVGSMEEGIYREWKPIVFDGIDYFLSGVGDESSSQHPIRVSTFSLTCGYIWICLLKSLETTKGKKSFLGFAADFRSRLEPPLPATYFGNCISGSVVAADKESLLGENGLSSAVAAISEEIRKLDENGLFKGQPTTSSSDAENHEIQVTFSLAGSHRFNVYGVDFGWEKPRKVMMASLSMAETIGISDSKTSKGGVQIELVLPKQEMEIFASLFAKGLEAL
ncbi:anthocyanin 5-aromatic acyltransferase-like [Ziziphus jujuba]|uniref:Anthocyanin 5-aromatic acyltransferase-like n=1 Tax=Ziziphus jujuba TaxID=326968 RepID=A0ABM4A996_ZIZJJ|nr:anthocyanin 5-aromatic acyltransferase-like [Ziziphus jujuba]